MKSRIILGFVITFVLFIMFGSFHGWSTVQGTIKLKCPCSAEGSSIYLKIKNDEKLRIKNNRIDIYDKIIQNGITFQSWDDFLKFKNEYFESDDFSSKITPQIFNKYNLGLIIVEHDNSTTYTKNESIISSGGYCSFYYEVWDTFGCVQCSCTFQDIYLLKLRKH